MQRWLWLSLCFGGCLLLAPALPVWARLKTIKGDTSAFPSSTGNGYIVRTGPDSRAAILFSDGSQVKLNANTTLEIPGAALGVDPSGPRVRLIAEGSRDNSAALLEGPIPPRLVLQQGEVWEDIAPGRTVTTEVLPFGARAEAEGTELNLKLTNNRAASIDMATLTVREGRAEFTNAQVSVPVRKAEQSQARPGQPPTRPQAAGNLPLILEWTNELQPTEFILEASFLDPDRPGRAAVAGDAALREAEALPDGGERWQRRGDIRHDRGELQEALSDYESARSALAPQTPAAERAVLEARIGQTLLESRRFPEAETAFRRSLELNPEGAAARAGMAVTWMDR
jgi:tetratricopeptide (TPR) repeat protein